jgi:hypothetical protein
MQIYVEGLGKGFVYANVVMNYETGKNIFCTADTFILETDNFIRILDDQIKRAEASDGFEKTQKAPRHHRSQAFSLSLGNHRPRDNAAMEI